MPTFISTKGWKAAGRGPAPCWLEPPSISASVPPCLSVHAARTLALQKVISCIQIAAQVTEHFSRIGRTSELAGPVQQLCSQYMSTIAVSYPRIIPPMPMPMLDATAERDRDCLPLPSSRCFAHASCVALSCEPSAPGGIAACKGRRRGKHYGAPVRATRLPCTRAGSHQHGEAAGHAHAPAGERQPGQGKAWSRAHAGGGAGRTQ